MRLISHEVISETVVTSCDCSHRRSPVRLFSQETSAVKPLSPEITSEAVDYDLRSLARLLS